MERKAKPTACAVRVPAIVLEMQPRLVHLCFVLRGSSECIQTEKLKHFRLGLEHARGKFPAHEISVGGVRKNQSQNAALGMVSDTSNYCSWVLARSTVKLVHVLEIQCNGSFAAVAVIEVLAAAVS